MSFCKKNVYSLLCNFIDSKNRGTIFYCSPIQSRNFCVPTVDGLSFLTTLKTQSPVVNVVESTTIKPPPSPSTAKQDLGRIAFLGEVDGSVDGLMSCTESLGFESSDERRIGDQTMEDFRPMIRRPRSKRNDNAVVKREVKKFPPPLSSLNNNGKPTFFLRPVRIDGRLELRIVKIQRPEILHASRQNGRLKLDFIVNEEIHDIEDEENDVEEVSHQNLQPRLDFTINEKIDNIDNQNQDKKEEIIQEESEEEKEERGVDGCKFLAKSGSRSESFRRCHELSHRGSHCHHHHHNLHVWSQPCVTIR
ncbi:hypothetical protein LguiA_018941 [Lonicera macranthoides]